MCIRDRGATFHYEAGLQARIPAGRELECFNAWNEAWTLLPLDVEHRGVFRTSGSRDAIARTDNDKVLGMYERSDSERGWVLVLGEGELGPVLADGWSVADTRAIGGGTLLSVARAIR